MQTNTEDHYNNIWLHKDALLNLNLSACRHLLETDVLDSLPQLDLPHPVFQSCYIGSRRSPPVRRHRDSFLVVAVDRAVGRSAHLRTLIFVTALAFQLLFLIRIIGPRLIRVLRLLNRRSTERAARLVGIMVHRSMRIDGLWRKDRLDGWDIVARHEVVLDPHNLKEHN